jgi:uncharacterized membrane protein YhdT
LQFKSIVDEKNTIKIFFQRTAMWSTRQILKRIEQGLGFIGLLPESSPPQASPASSIVDGIANINKNKNAWELFKYFREEIQHEHTLLMGRVTWYITCQSFLLTVYGITYSNSRGPNWFSNILLPILGISVTFLALNMIQGATLTIKMWSEMRVDLINNYPELDPVLITRWRSNSNGQNHKDAIHVKALWFPRFIPMIFLITWILISYLSWQNPWLFPLVNKTP